MWIVFGWLGEYTNQFFNDSIKREYCVYSSNPNGIIDLSVANDNTCKTAFFGMLGEEELSQQSFQIYPNPASSVLNIKYTSMDEVLFHITNSVGQVFQYDTLKISTIDISDLSFGIYFLSLLDNSGNLVETQRFIKN